MRAYPKIESVVPAENNCLVVRFVDGTCKLYDCSPLMATEPFTALSQAWLFRTVHVDPGGRGISWTDEIDLSESELWEEGKTLDGAAAPYAHQGD